MIEKTGPSSVRSDTGFEIKFAGFHKMEYHEGERILSVEIERGQQMGVYVSGITEWLPPNQRIPLTKVDKHRIIENIKDALNLLEIQYELE